jgi:hypothetical protein
MEAAVDITVIPSLREPALSPSALLRTGSAEVDLELTPLGDHVFSGEHPVARSRVPL